MAQAAFVTSRKVPDLTADDRLVVDALAAAGVDVTPVIWDAPDVDWPGFSAVVIRSAWDYHLKRDAYEAWLRSREEDGTNLWNPARAVLANVHKGYLDSFSRRGIPIVPTTFVRAGEGQSLRTILERERYDHVVVKPAVSANARGTWRASLASPPADHAAFDAQAAVEDVLVQPYLDEVASEGEWSLVFFGDTFSHAVLKQPARGEFRVQEHLGGGAIAAEPPAQIIEQAHAVLAKAAAPLLYARVDGIVRDGRFLLMELEINEPSLFLGLSDGSAQRFARAIKEVLHA